MAQGVKDPVVSLLWLRMDVTVRRVQSLAGKRPHAVGEAKKKRYIDKKSCISYFPQASLFTQLTAFIYFSN